MKRTLLAICLSVSACFALPAHAQDWDFENPVTDRVSAGGMLVAVYNPATDVYITISLNTLLADLVTFDDGLTRYVAVKDSPTAPTFSATDFENGSSGGLLTGVAFPAIATDVASVWIGVAVPASAVPEYLAWGATNPSINFINVMERLTDTITIGTVDYVVFRSFTRQGAPFLSAATVYFTPGS